MPLIPVYVIPGVCKSTTDYSAGKTAGVVKDRMAAGRITDCDKIRWNAGFPEKIGGWAAVDVDAMTGVPRASRQWRSIAGASLLGVGTDSHLYVFDGTTLEDITPLRTIVTGTLTNKLSTTINSATVAVADTAQTLVNGDWVYLSAASAIGGLTILGWYQVSARTGAGYNITASSAATSTVALGGGVLTYGYPRTTLTNPFATVSGSATVTVTHTGIDADVGNFVVFSGAATFNGVTIDGEYEIQTVTDPNTYTITAATTANATGSGGGAAVSAIYLIGVPDATDLVPIAYGDGPYGPSPYGYGPFNPVFLFPGWTLAAYGSQLLANPIGGSIYVYDPAAGGRAYPLLNAPAVVQAIIVTPERFVVALGATATGQTTNTLRIAWADQTDYTIWTATPTNTANEGRILQGGAFFVGGTPDVNGTSLIVTNRCVFQMLYTGDNQVYNTPVASDNAGLISPWAIVAQGGAVFWMSDREFWMWNGSVQALPSDDIREYVFGPNGLNQSVAGKCFAALNRQFREVWFFYPSQNSTEVDSYVIWSITQQCFSIGTMDRTTWSDSELFPTPMACSPDGVLYQQEVGTDADGAAMAASMVFSPADISNGALNVDIFGFIPDIQNHVGDLSLNILTRFYPADANTVDGPYTLSDDDTTPRIDLRSDGKMIGFELESNEIGGTYRLAMVRVDAQPAGARW